MGLSYLEVGLVFASSASSGTSFSTQTAFLLLTSSGLTAVVVAIITAVVNKRKLKAEEVNIISQAAGNIVDRLEHENLRLRQDLQIGADRIADLELIEAKRKMEAEVHYDQLRMHRAYDERLIKALEGVGISVEEPPPLFPIP